MLVVVRKDQPKIAMGLFSYLPELPDVAAVQREISWYQASDKRDILLWQDPESQHYTAVVGVELVFESVIVRHFVCSPEVDDDQVDALGVEILQALMSRYPDKAIMGTMANQAQLTKWRQEIDG